MVESPMVYRVIFEGIVKLAQSPITISKLINFIILIFRFFSSARYNPNGKIGLQNVSFIGGVFPKRIKNMPQTPSAARFGCENAHAMFSNREGSYTLTHAPPFSVSHSLK
jgi:hypothetical protein